MLRGRVMSSLSGKFAMLPIEAISDRRLGVIELRVLLILHSFRGSIHTTEVFPRRGTIALRTGYSEATVSRAIRGLINRGWVVTKQHRGPNTYILRCGGTVPDPVTVADSAINSDQSGQETVTDPATPKEIKKRPVEERKRKGSVDHPLFAKWYEHYPVKKSRAKASQAFSKLDPDEHQVNEMIEAIGRQSRERADKHRRNVFVPEWKHPATWLNGECWLDEPDVCDVNLPAESDYAAGGI